MEFFALDSPWERVFLTDRAMVSTDPGREAEMLSRRDYDVVICGGGLAGCSLALQLGRSQPTLRIALVERTPRPLPKAAFKVGESTVEVGAHYFGEVLGLTDYIAKRQLPKLGLRFFFQGDSDAIQERLEFGAAEFPPVPSYQFDRGVLEQDLRGLLDGLPVEQFEGYSVKDVELAAGDEQHLVRISAVEPGRELLLTARFVVDAMGRRKLLQRKLGWGRKSEHEASAAWFRVEGEVDVEDLVPETESQWHERVQGRRYYSTNHFMGSGYWVWLIPLSSGATSVGIVVDEKVHPLRDLCTFEKSLAWLRRHEPRLATSLEDRTLLDFKGYKNYSYSAKQVYARRFSCVGEAGVFTDPFYSPGSDFIAYSNTITCALIAADRSSSSSEEMVRAYNRFYLDELNEIQLQFYRGTYSIFGVPHVMSAKVYWDTAYYWAFSGRLFFNGVFLDLELLERMFPLFERFKRLNQAVQKLFVEWGRATRFRPEPGFIGYFSHPLVKLLHVSLRNRRSGEVIVKDLADLLVELERWALVLLWRALLEVRPEHHLSFEELAVLDPTAISLSEESPRVAVEDPEKAHAAEALRVCARQFDFLFQGPLSPAGLERPPRRRYRAGLKSRSPERVPLPST